MKIVISTKIYSWCSQLDPPTQGTTLTYKHWRIVAKQLTSQIWRKKTLIATRQFVTHYLLKQNFYNERENLTLLSTYLCQTNAVPLSPTTNSHNAALLSIHGSKNRNCVTSLWQCLEKGAGKGKLWSTLRTLGRRTHPKFLCR